MSRNYPADQIIAATRACEENSITLQIRTYTNPKEAARDAVQSIAIAVEAGYDFFRVIDLPDTRLLVSMNMLTEEGVDVIFMELQQEGETENAYTEIMPFLDEPTVTAYILAWRNDEDGLDYQFLASEHEPSKQAQMFFKQVRKTIVERGGRRLDNVRSVH